MIAICFNSVGLSNQLLQSFSFSLSHDRSVQYMTKRWKDTIVLPADSPPNETSNGEASNALWKLAQGAHSSWSGNGLFRVRIQIGLVQGITKL